MFISKKKFKEIEAKITLLENKVNLLQNVKTADPVDEISYKEVIDEWLNGKKM
jgi:hypothetical protein